MAPVNPDRKGADDEGRESFWQRLYLTANVTFHVPFYTVLFSFIAYGSLIKYSPNTLVRSALLLYFPYCILDPTPTTGISWLSDATINRIRSLRCFKDAARFLRARLIKTHELDPKQAYILAYHPHGVISMGGNVCLITNGADFPRVFPGIQRWGVTLRQVFWCPFYREWLLINGLVCADKATLQSKLTAGDSIVLVPGGAAEALYAATGRFTLYLNDRKGFIKLAMETGAQVVPCLGFGENAVSLVTNNPTRPIHACLTLPGALFFYADL
jgi:hypothetical protein